MLRFLWRLFLFAILLVFVLPVVVVVTSFEDEPTVLTRVSLQPGDLARAKQLAEENDPRKMQAGEIRNLTLTEADVNLLGNYALTQFTEGGMLIDLKPGGLLMSATAAVPENPLSNALGRYLNLDLELYEEMGRIKVQSMRLGSLKVPRAVGQAIVDSADKFLRRDADYVAVLNAINGYRFTERHAMLLYQWLPDLAERLENRGRGMAIPEELKRSILAYSRRIAEVSGDPNMDKTVPLGRFLEPLFRLAKQRSTESDPAAENRALITAVGFYVNGTNPARLLGVGEEEVGQPMPRTLTLLGREDFVQHFMTSAILAATGGSQLADTVGLFKEVDDATTEGGSGFSFNDLAADRAGVRFGELAVSGTAGAQKVQNLMAEGPWESDYMPSVEGLPEFLSAARFKQEYQRIGSPAYNVMMQDIEDRIAATKLHKR